LREINSKNDYWRWNVVLSVWSWKHLTKFATETAVISMTQGSLHVEIANEDIAHNFFQYQGYRSLLIYSTRPDSQPSLLCGNTHVHEHVHRKRLELLPSIGFSTIAMLQLTKRALSSSFWPKNWLLKRNMYPVSLIWFWMTCGCFQKWSLP
jgi:hypothetical protein